MVLLHSIVLREKEKRKFLLPHLGPCKVIEDCPPNYVIANDDDSVERRVHFNRLKRCFGDNTRNVTGGKIFIRPGIFAAYLENRMREINDFLHQGGLLSRKLFLKKLVPEVITSSIGLMTSS